MNRFFTILTLAFASVLSSVQGQSVIDFENFGLEVDTFLNGSDGTSEFVTDFANFPINYNSVYNSWTGWSISTVTDNTTPGFVNQYSAIPGEGVNGSSTYATSFNFQPNTFSLSSSISTNENLLINGIYITNATYTYLSMLNGDSFAKKFGGVTGDDPDFLLLTIKGLNLEMEQDSVEFYLADYRFEDNAEDYLIDEWTYVDLSKFGTGQTLSFQLTSSDVGAYGVNTPQYFCIDNIEFEVITSTEDESFTNLNVYPNPSTDYINIDFESQASYTISTANGQVLSKSHSLGNRIDISNLQPGIYNLQVTTDKGTATRRFLKI